MHIRTWKRGISLLWRFYLIFSLISIIPVFDDFVTTNINLFNLFNEIQSQEDDKFDPVCLRIPPLKGGQYCKVSDGNTITNTNSNENEISGVLLDIQSQYSIPGWADTRWPLRKNITIDHTKVSADLTNFPMFVEIFDPNLHATTQPDGDDIVFTDLFGNQLDHEIEVYNPNFNATHAYLVAWIRTNLSSTQDSLISMYYGNHTVGSQEHAEAVWDGSYVGVWHLNEQAGNSTDSTSFKTEGMVSGGVTRGVSGKTGPSYRFDPSGRFNTTDPGDGHLDFGSGDFSISFWSRVNQDTGSFQGFLQKGARWVGDPGYSVSSDATGSYFQAVVQDSVEVVEASPGNFAFDIWYYVVTQLDRSTETLSLFVNGVFIDSSNASLIGNIDSSAGLEIPSPTYPIDGFMDEIRLSNIVCSHDWIATEFNNQLDPLSFYSVGIEEHLPDIEPPIVEDFGVMDLGMGTATFWVNITDVSPVISAEIGINGTNYIMSFNGTHWIHQIQVVFGGYYTYQIVNASDSNGNYLTTPTNLQNYVFNLDFVPPNVLDWEYITLNNTFQSNVTDLWGEIDRVLVNVTTYNIKAKMVQYTIFGTDILAYMNDTLNMPNGLIDFQIIVNDTSGNEFTSSTHSGFVFSNTAPVASDLTLSRDQFQVLLPIYSNSTLYLDYTYFDAEAHSEAGTEIRWYKNNGTGFQLQSNRNDTFNIPASELMKGDQWYATVKPKDGDLFGEINQTATITIQNTPPRVTSVIVSPSNPTTTQALSVSNTTVDDDGDSITAYQIRWYIPSYNATYDNLAIIPSTETTKGESWWCELRVFDGTNYSVWVQSNSVTIGNSPPVVSDVTINGFSSPIQVLNDTNLVVGYTFTDADGDPESIPSRKILWYRNGMLIASLNDSSVVTAGNTSIGDIWYYTISVSDGTEYSTVVSSPFVTIALIPNTQPLVGNLTLSPFPLHTIDDLTLSYDYYDIDGDPEVTAEIHWFKDAIYQPVYDDLVTIPASALIKGDEWNVTVRSYDGLAWSALQASSTIIVQNSAPTASNVQINAASTTIYTTYPLTVTWEFHDPDSQDSQSSFLILWYLYGVEQTQFENNSNIPANYTLKNQEWLVSIGVRDNGGLWSDLVNSSVVIITNSPPTVNNIVIIPEYPNETENLVANWDYYDVDGDPQNTSFIIWYRNGVEQVAYMNLNIIPSSETANGEDWYFAIHVYDGTSNSTLEISPHVVIGSSLLVLNIESPTDTTYSTKTITINLSGNVEYHWYFIEEIDTNNRSWTTSLDRIFDDGTYTIHAYGNDSIGNTIHVQTTFNVDTIPPEVNILSPTNSIYGTEVLIDLSGDDDILWLIYNIEGVHTRNQSWSKPVNVSLSDGSYLIHAYGSDSAGNIAYKTVIFYVDAIPPIVTIIRPSENLETPMQTESIKIVWSVSDSYGFSETEVFINGSFVTTVSFPCCVLEISLVEGLHNIEIVVTDLVGNRGSALITVLVTSSERLEESDNSTGFSVIFPLLSLIGFGLLLRKRIIIKKEV